MMIRLQATGIIIKRQERCQLLFRINYQLIMENRNKHVKQAITLLFRVQRELEDKEKR